MDSLEQDYVKKRKIYREIFQKSQEAVLGQLTALKKLYLCNDCTDNCCYKNKKVNLFETFPDGCIYKKWQDAALDKLKNQIAKDVYFKIQDLLKTRELFSCNRCALCCKFACSEFSYEELKEKAKNGDKFAKQFTSIFVPYEDKEEAEKIFPDYVALLKNKYGHVEDIHFYHCPKLSDENLCTDYENRPDICRDFPNNALAILPDSCGFRGWKDENEILALTLHALAEIVDFLVQKLEDLTIEDKH